MDLTVSFVILGLVFLGIVALIVGGTALAVRVADRCAAQRRDADS